MFSIFSNAPVLISAKDLNGNIILANKYFKNISPEFPDELIGKNIFDGISWW